MIRISIRLPEGFIFDFKFQTSLSNVFSMKKQTKEIPSADCILWQYGLSSFQAGDTKLERFLPKNQHTERKLLNFENWINGKVSKSAKIWLSKSIFLLFDTSPLTQFSKFNNFLWVCWILGKNLSNFVYPAWKLDNPYCHSQLTRNF